MLCVCIDNKRWDLQIHTRNIKFKTKGATVTDKKLKYYERPTRNSNKSSENIDESFSRAFEDSHFCNSGLLACWLAGRLPGRLAGWLACWLAGWLAGCMASCWPAGWLLACLARSGLCIMSGL